MYELEIPNLWSPENSLFLMFDHCMKDIILRLYMIKKSKNGEKPILVTTWEKSIEVAHKKLLSRNGTKTEILNFLFSFMETALACRARYKYKLLNSGDSERKTDYKL
jgi:hypothetical protein